MATAAVAMEDVGEKRGRDGADGLGEKRQHVGEEIILKMAITSREAGVVIGKAGANMNTIMEQAGAKVRISRPDEVLPGSGDRVAVISGNLQQVLHAQHLACEFCHEPRPGDEPAPDGQRTLKLLVPNAGAGVVIGKGGETIRTLKEATGAEIRVSQPAELIQATGERIITITGTQACNNAAALAITDKLYAAPAGQQPRDIAYSVLKAGPPAGAYGAPPAAYGAPPAFGAPPPLNRPVEYKDFIGALGNVSPQEALARYQEYLRAYSAAPGGAPAASPSQAAPVPPSASGPQTSHSLPLPDKVISGIIGKGGAIIKEIGTRSGARVLVSQKDDLTAGGERTVRITGSPEQVAAAQHLISERCREIEADLVRRAAGGGGGGPPAASSLERGLSAAPPFAAPANPYAAYPGYTPAPAPAGFAPPNPYSAYPGYAPPPAAPSGGPGYSSSGYQINPAPSGW